MRRAHFLALLVALTLASPLLAQGDPVETHLRQLNSANFNERIAAMAALGEMGPKGAKAVPALLKSFAIKNEDLRLNAALALGKIGKPAVPGLVETLKQADPDVRYYTLSALGWIGPAAKDAAPAVVNAFADQRSDVRRKAAFALGAIAPEPKAAVKELVRLLNDSNTEVRQAAADALLARFGASAVPELVPLLQGGRQTAIEAAKALGKIGPEAKPAIPILKDWLRLADGTSPQIAAETLAQIGKDAVPVLSDALKGKDGVADPKVLRAMVTALGKLGADGAPALIDALGNEKPEVRQLAAQQLGVLKIGDKMVVLALAHLLKDANDPVKIAAARALQQIGPQAKLAAPALPVAVRDSNPQVRQTALFARVVGGDPAMMLPALKELIKDADPVVRRQAVPLLTGQGSAAVPLVMEMLRDMDPTVRGQALTALQSLQGDLKAALPALKELSKDPAVTVRRAAVLALGKADADAVPLLLDAYADQDATVRRNVLMAFRTLGPAAAKATPKLKDILEKETVLANRRLIVVALLNIDDAAAQVGVEHVRKANDAILWNQAVQNAGPGVASAKVTVPFLIDALKSVQPAVRTQVVNQLANHGPAAKEALPALRGLATDTNPTLCAAVEAAIKRIDTK